MESFPAFFPLTGRRVVIAGAGEFADAKAALFDGSPAEVVRLAGARAMDANLYRGAVLAFVACDDEDACRAAAQAARDAGVPVNVVDRPELCDFFTPALVDRGEVVAAVGTGGASPVLAQQLKREIEASVPEGTGRVAALLRQFRQETLGVFPDMAERRVFIQALLSGPAAEAALAGDMEGAQALVRKALDAVSRS